MDYSSSFVCELKECKKYLDNPVTLPCGNTICRIHLIKYLDFKNNIFKCDICEEEHSIPKEGFRINKNLSKLIDSNIHLNPQQKQVKINFQKIESLIINFQTSNLANGGELYLHDYFSKLKNQIDMHRENLIAKIENKSDRLLKHVNEIESKFKLNLPKIEHINLNEWSKKNMIKWKEKLDTPNIDQNELYLLNIEINSKITDIKSKIKKFEKDVLMGKTISFEPLANKLFGKLTIKQSINAYSNEDFGASQKSIANYDNEILVYPDSIYCGEIQDKNTGVYRGELIKLKSSSYTQSGESELNLDSDNLSYYLIDEN